MAKFGWNERELFYVSNFDLENLSSNPSDPDSNQIALFAKDDHIYRKKQAESAVCLVESASNVGTGIGVFDSKSTEDLQFRSIKSTDGHLDIALNGSDIEMTVDISDINDELDHGLLLGLSDDDHSQYLLLAGRSGGQIANGGTDASDDLELRSTADSTKGRVKIVDGSSFQHSDKFMQQYELQTVDATTATLASIPVTADRAGNIQVVVVCRRSDGGGEARASWRLSTTAYRIATGDVTLQGSVKQDYKSASQASLNADLDGNSNNIRVRVTGIAAQDFEWKAYVEYLESD